MKPIHAGELLRRRSRSTGTIVSLFRAIEAGLDPEGGPYATVCEDHGTILNHRTYALARRHLPTCGWCEACRGQEDTDA